MKVESLSIEGLLDLCVPVPMCGCWLWLHEPTKAGYGRLHAGGLRLYAHRTMLELKLGRPLAAGEHALHECDVKACIAPGHLYAGTHQQNMDDMWARGQARPLEGVEHGSALLDDGKVIEIRRRYASERISQAALGRVYGISARHVCAIVRGENWKHLPLHQRPA